MVEGETAIAGDPTPADQVATARPNGISGRVTRVSECGGCRETEREFRRGGAPGFGDCDGRVQFAYQWRIGGLQCGNAIAGGSNTSNFASHRRTPARFRAQTRPSQV